MAVVVYTDVIAHGTIAISEDQGTIVSASRQWLVTGLTGDVEDRMADAKNATGVPSYGDSYPGNPNLIAKTIDVSILDASNNSKAVVTVGYVTVGNEDGFFRFSGSSSVTQETTTVDAGGNDIVVSYDGLSQGAEAEWFRPQGTLSTTGIISTSQPVPLRNSWVGYLNSDTWMGRPAGCWMCTRCDFAPHDLADSPPRYKFTFEFQENNKGWTPTVYYRDPNTGEIPPDLVYGVGKKRIVVQGYRAFGERFPSV